MFLSFGTNIFFDTWVTVALPLDYITQANLRSVHHWTLASFDFVANFNGCLSLDYFWEVLTSSDMLPLLMFSLTHLSSHHNLTLSKVTLILMITHFFCFHHIKSRDKMLTYCPLYPTHFQVQMKPDNKCNLLYVPPVKMLWLISVTKLLW